MNINYIILLTKISVYSKNGLPNSTKVSQLFVLAYLKDKIKVLDIRSSRPLNNPFYKRENLTNLILIVF